MKRSAIERDLRAAVPGWLEGRLYVAAAFIVSWAIVDRLEPEPAFTPIEDGLLAWDGTWYRSIAENGYSGAEDEALRFFPLYPLLGRWLGELFGGASDVALVLIANVAALVAGVLLHRLVMQETRSAALARRSTVILALFPTAFVFVLAYSESLFLVWTIGAFLAIRSERWWVAALLGVLAGLTRPVGVLLALPILYTLWRERRFSVARLAAAASAPLGAAAFFAWSWWTFDDLTAPADRQRALRGGFSEPVSRVVRAAWRGLDGDEGELFHFGAAVVLIALTVVVVRRLPPVYAAYQIPSTVLLLASDNLNSMERYALGSFPIVIAVAFLTAREAIGRIVSTISAVALMSLTVLALHGVYVP